LVRWVTAIYSVLVCLAAGFAFYRGNFAPANSEFSGLPLLLLAVPWSWWFRAFNPVLVRSEFNNSLIVTSAYAAINIVLLLIIGRLLAPSSRSR